GRRPSPRRWPKAASPATGWISPLPWMVDRRRPSAPGGLDVGQGRRLHAGGIILPHRTACPRKGCPGAERNSVMTLKSILVNVDDDKNCAARVELTLKLASSFKAHVTGLH